jgi:hypothetical protein
LRLKRGLPTNTAGSGGTAPTKNAVDSGDTKAAQATLRANDTTQATTTGNGSVFVMLLYDNWNVLLPFDYMPGPEDEDREGILVSEALCLDLPATIVATVVSGYIKWAEVP